MLRRASEIRGDRLEARDGTIGKSKDFLFDDESWTVRYLVADTGGWLSGRRVLLSPSAVMAAAIDHNKLPVDLTKAQIEKSPGIETDQPVSERHQLELHAYYGWPAYWGIGPYPMAGMVPPPGAPVAPASTRGDVEGRATQQDTGDPHLRSMEQVTDYGIHATDGAIGHVEDFLIDLDAWTVRAIVVDTRNWLPGKKVVLPPGAIDRVSWTDSEVSVHLTRDAIERSPEYSRDTELPVDYERQLAAHYEGMTKTNR